MVKFVSIIWLTLLFQQTNWNTDKTGVAVEGYDVVNYFSGTASKGSEKFSTKYDGVIFYFSSAANLSMFQSNPQKYAPQYGGYCAYAMGLNGEKVSINPKTYKITDGKLYLFYNSLGTNTLKPWNENELDLMKKADQNWQSKYLND